MDTILDFLVDNYIWVLIISVFLIVVLIGYIADQKKKLKNIRQQNEQGVVNSNVNAPIQEEVPSVNVAPNPVVSEPIVSEPVNNVTDTIETPAFEPVNNEVSAPIAEAPVSEVTSPVAEAPVVEAPIGEVVTPITEPVVEQPVNNLENEPIMEEAPQTILDIPDNVTDIGTPVQESITKAPTPIEVETPVVEDAEIISEPEIIDEPVIEQNVVNSWEPELATENKDIISETEIKDSI